MAEGGHGGAEGRVRAKPLQGPPCDGGLDMGDSSSKALDLWLFTSEVGVGGPVVGVSEQTLVSL